MSQAKNLTQTNNTIASLTPQSGRHLLLKAGFWLPIIFMGITAILFNLFPIDLAVQDHYYSDGWHLNENSLVRFVYNYSNLPALFTVIAALILYALSYSRLKRYAIYRKIFIYLTVMMVLGPGLVINALLKENWGRPRPRQLVEYGGIYQYEAPLNIDKSSPGKSFPCGHASMGFYFFALAFALSPFRRKAALFTHIFAAIYGGLIGWVRIMQGGHFLSDVIFSGCIVYLLSLVVWHLMRLHHSPLSSLQAPKKSISKAGKIAIAGVIVLIIIATSLGTPHNKMQSYKDDRLDAESIELNLNKAQVVLEPANRSQILFESIGFGFPGSKNRLKLHSSENSISFTQETKGFFSELNTNALVLLDSLKATNFSLNVNSGEIYYTPSAGWLISHSDDESSIRISKPDRELSITLNLGDALLIPMDEEGIAKHENTKNKIKGIKK